MNIKKVLIADKVHDILPEELKKMGYEVIYRPEIDYDSVGKMLSGLSGIIVNTRTPMRRDYIDMGEKLEFIARLGSGLDIIDVEYAQEKGVRVISAPEGNANAVAEHALGMMLSLMHRLVVSDNAVSNLAWPREYCRGTELEGKTIGVIGVGNNGTKFIEKLASLSVNVIYYDKYRQRFPDSIRYASCKSENTVISQSDVISIHIPLNKDTEGMINTEWLQKCKPGVILINTSRGRIVNTSDLISSLENGFLGGACLDVLDDENPQEWSIEHIKMMKKMFNMDNTILSPHVAGWTKESFRKIAETIVEKLNKN